MVLNLSVLLNKNKYLVAEMTAELQKDKKNE
jgi:hypothetical protein